MQRTKKLILVVLLVSLFSIGVVGAWDILFVQATLTINEPISIRPSTFSITAYAGETKVQNLTIRNSANKDIIVDVDVYFLDGQGQTQIPQGIDVNASVSGVIIPEQEGRLWCWTITDSSKKFGNSNFDF